MLKGNGRGRRILQKLSLVLAGAALMNSLIAPANADDQNASDAPGVPPRATVVGRELVYPDGVTVSLDAGTGLSSDAVSRQSSQAIDLDSLPRATVIGCDPGYTCLYENIGYGGRRLQWRDLGQGIDLRNYNFDNQMESWRNRNSVDARWFPGNIPDYPATSYCMDAGANNTDVGDGRRNTASSLAIYTDNRACGSNS